MDRDNGAVVSVEGGSSFALRNASVTRLTGANNGYYTSCTALRATDTTDVTVEGLTAADSFCQQPAIWVERADSFSLSGSTFRNLSTWSDPEALAAGAESSPFQSLNAPSVALGVSLNGVRAAAVSGCVFDRLDWLDTYETQALVLGPALPADGSDPDGSAGGGGSLVVSDTNFTSILGGGTALRVYGADLDLRRVRFADINRTAADTAQRRAVVVADVLTRLAATDCTWERVSMGNSTNGGAISVDEVGALSLTRCRFTDVAFSAVPAVQVLRGAGDVAVEGCTVERGNGRGWLFLYTLSGQLTVRDSNLQRNNQNTSGPLVGTAGAVQILECPPGGQPGQFRVQLRNSSFSGWVGRSGGALYTCASTLVEDCRFDGNVGEDSGGAISHFGGDLDVRRTAFSRNTAYGSGGAITSLLSTNGTTGGLTATFTDCTFTNNTASKERSLNARANGGAVSLTAEANSAWYGFLNVTRCNFTNNRADATGGAIATAKLQMELSESRFISNTAAAAAGAVSVATCATCQPYTAQGVAPNVNVAGCLFQANSANSRSGALEVVDDGDECRSICPGLYRRPLSSAFPPPPPSTTPATSPNFTVSPATQTPWTNSIVFVYPSADGTPTRFLSNRAGQIAGAMYVQQARMGLEGVVVEGNTAQGAGAVLQVGGLPLGPSEAYSYVRGSTFRNNSCFKDTRQSKRYFGGALSVSSVVVSLACPTDPFAPDVSEDLSYAEPWRFAVAGSVFEDNECQYGGAIATSTMEGLVLINSSFTRNTAPAGGGAVVLPTQQQGLFDGLEQNLYVDGCNFTANTGGVTGGAILVGLHDRVGCMRCGSCCGQPAAGGAGR